jgi:hypothetical protein
VAIPDTVPWLSDKRIFFDMMGSSLITAFVDVDLKIYEKEGTRPLYQARVEHDPEGAGSVAERERRSTSGSVH